MWLSNIYIIISKFNDLLSKITKQGELLTQFNV
jgi:hypothetical protein